MNSSSLLKFLRYDVASSCAISSHLLKLTRRRFVFCALASSADCDAKRCRSNLFKRHRFANANSKYQLLEEALC
ncbi:hypothetical protein F511_17160 [Dorcoceras hygrometricum]|uniref:Uncharacterized protein n=1 Tax=Dorcoceras hygrometricum TaxID=472368 RepID=A0A2Z7C5J9_9LAMI|nr:hypothetical protein F511_17160 [Dorcoceras hygrometricum]